MMELSAKIFKSFMLLTVFAEKAPTAMLDWILNTPVLSSKKMQTMRSGGYQLV